MPPFRDEHILVISPGSRTTIAQLGLPESLTPPKFRIPSRMFPCGPGKYSFHKIREAREGEKDGLAQNKSIQQQQDADDEDDDEEDDEDDTQKPGETPGPIKDQQEVKDSKPEETRINDPDEMDEDADNGPQLVEDLEDEEGAVWCMEKGRVVDWRAFFAMLHYVYETLNPTFHTPILLVHPPEFTRADKERVTQFIFEKLKAPGLALLDSAVAALWAYGLATATIVDVGFSKTSITPLADFIVQERARKTLDNCGGETMTQHLCSLLPDLKPEWVETLKKSPICEILPPGMPAPGSGEIGSYVPIDEEEDINMLGEDEGTINVAAIVASGKTKEFLAQKEKEKRGEAERKLPNRERESNYFWVVDQRQPGEVDAVASTLTSPVTAEGPGLPAPVAEGAAPETQEGQLQVTTVPAPSTSTSPTTATFPHQDPEQAHKESEKRKQTRLAESQGIHLKPTETWRELSVGTERFRAAECDLLQTIADGIYESVERVEEIGKRSEMWDNIIVVGNGSKVKGFKDALLHTLHSKHLIPPSSGTIFSSSLPSGTSTPLGTPGASTPLPNHHPNPLLVAATTGNFQHQQHPYHPHQTFHSQSPASIKLAKIPEYFPEWKDVGFEDAHFLGAQVAAKVVFVIDQGANRGFIGRVEYNEMGPEGIHDATV